MNTTYTLSMDFEYDKIVSTNIVGYGVVITGEENRKELTTYLYDLITKCGYNGKSKLERIRYTLFKNSDTILIDDVTVPSSYLVLGFVDRSLQAIKEDKENNFLIEEVVEENESNGREDT